jgi:SAM-dependent methyltransferase
MIRKEVVVDRAMTSVELGQSIGAPDNLTAVVLVQRPEGARLLGSGEPAQRGDRVVVYALDTGSYEDLAAANALFSDFYYVNAHGDLWPDERAVIEELVPERDAAVLEICCGAGRVSGALVRGGNRVTAIDVSQSCIHYAAAVEVGLSARQNRARVDYRVADAQQLPFADQSFEIGCCFENSLGVFFSRRRQVLSELVRVCRRRVILGLRTVEGVGLNELQMYTVSKGFLEFAHVHAPESMAPLVDGLPRVTAQSTREGAPRPWGGREWFLILELGTEAEGGSRNT